MPLRVLLTNDDGINAPALGRLARRLSHAGHQVQVVAPYDEHSGCGASIGRMRDGLRVSTKEVVLVDAPDVPALAVDAPPALGVLAGCSGMYGPSPQVVVSGINDGLNTGPTVLHSGTLGAALTAAANGVPGIALSTERGAADGFATAEDFCVSGLEALVAALGPGLAANINVPDLPTHELGGIRATSLAEHSLVSIGLSAEQNVLRLDRKWLETAEPDSSDSDVSTIRAGFISVTVVHGGVRDLSDRPVSQLVALQLLRAMDESSNHPGRGRLMGGSRPHD